MSSINETGHNQSAAESVCVTPEIPLIIKTSPITIREAGESLYHALLAQGVQVVDESDSSDIKLKADGINFTMSMGTKGWILTVVLTTGNKRSCNEVDNIVDLSEPLAANLSWNYGTIFQVESTDQETGLQTFTITGDFESFLMHRGYTEFFAVIWKALCKAISGKGLTN
ncbi:MAG: hypothetical protein WCI03_15060 [bacterium]